eukprot:scaffold8602_cov196-Amphora_coffeaeformis.AAC.16
MFEETVVESPFLMTYVGVVLCVLMFPVKWAHDWWKERQESLNEEAADTGPKDEDSFDEALNNATAYHDIVEVMTTRSVSMARSKRPWNHKKHALAALHVAPAMFLSDYAYNRGLQHTTVASSTVLVSTSCVFVLFLSVLLGLEPFRYGKLMGVLCAVIGTAMTTLHDATVQQELDEEAEYYHDNSQRDMVYGDVFSLMAAVGYAAYSVQARVLCPPDDELYSMTLLLGYVGLIVGIPLLPMALYKMYSMDPISWGTFWILMVKGLLDFVVTDYLLFRAVTLTNATVANVGLGLTIPIAFLADLIFKGIMFTHLQVAGALTVLAGFILVNWMNSLDEAEAAQQAADQAKVQEMAEVPKTIDLDSAKLT